jgi:hypothetical protein
MYTLREDGRGANWFPKVFILGICYLCIILVSVHTPTTKWSNTVADRGKKVLGGVNVKDVMHRAASYRLQPQEVLINVV